VFALITLIALNVLLHIFFIDSGIFNSEVQDNYFGGFITGLVIYVFIISAIAALGAFIRRFSNTGFNRRFFLYSIFLQAFFLFIHVYQIIINWLSG